MRAWITLFGVAVLPYFAAPHAEAQNARARYYDRTNPQRPALTGLRPALQRRNATFYSNRYRGMQTRLDRIRAASPIMRRRHGLLEDIAPSGSHTQYIFDQRNLLRSRSPLGKQATAVIGRYDYLPRKTDGPRSDSNLRPSNDEPSVQMPGHFDEHLANRLEKKADDYFELGIAFFRSRDMIQARNCFEIVRDLQRDRPRGFVCDVLTSYERRDYNQAISSLIRALERAETLDDLKIDRFIERLYEGSDFEEKQRKFRRTVESVNLFVKSQSEPSLVNLLLAYYAWLNGDLGTAISAIKVAEGSADEFTTPQVAKFRMLLIEAKNESSTSPDGV